MRGDGIKAKLRLDYPLSCWRDGNRTVKTPFHALFFLFRGSAGTILEHQHAFRFRLSERAFSAMFN
jgi:hypothetical protein